MVGGEWYHLLIFGKRPRVQSLSDGSGRQEATTWSFGWKMFWR